MIITAIVAMTPEGVIGRDGDMPWRLSSDLRRFKRLTMGGTLVMGRKTFESIGRPLPGRQSVVVTRTPDWSADGVTVAHDADTAIQKSDRDAIHIVGGGEIYRLFADRIDRWILTRVWSSVGGNTKISPDLSAFDLVSMTPVVAGPKDDVPTQVETWVRRKPAAS